MGFVGLATSVGFSVGLGGGILTIRPGRAGYFPEPQRGIRVTIRGEFAGSMRGSVFLCLLLGS